MRSRLRHAAARILTRGALDPFVDEILAAVSQECGAATPSDIDSILERAVSGVPYYRDLAPRVSSLTDLPVAHKALISSDPEAFKMRGVDRSGWSTRETSGSTGIPFTIFVDPERDHRHKAGAAAALKYAGGDPFAPILRARQWGHLSVKDRLVHVLKEYYAAHAGLFRATDAEPIAAWIRRKNGITVAGYPSYLEMVFRTMEEAGMEFPPSAVRAVVSGAEAPSPYFFASAKRLFGVTAHARYSCQELGVLSISSRTEPTAYKIDTSTFHVEILQETSDDPAPGGEIGRIVVTDLHNTAMPLLRYDTGDLGRFGVTSAGEIARNVLADVHGRRLDVLVGGTAEKPRRLHPMAIRGSAEQMVGVRQFQLRQHEIGRFTWVVNAERSADLEEQLRGILNLRIGDIQDCSIEYVDEMPVLASGKRQFFVTEIKDPLALVEGRA